MRGAIKYIYVYVYTYTFGCLVPSIKNTLCSERSELRQAKRASASEANDRSRMQAVVYRKLLTRQTKEPHITQTKKLHISQPKKLYIRHTKYWVWEQQTEVPGGRGGGGPRA